MCGLFGRDVVEWFVEAGIEFVLLRLALLT